MDRGKLIALLMAMTPEGAEGDSCDVFYEFLYDTFEVRGKNWVGNSLGANGRDWKRRLKSVARSRIRVFSGRKLIRRISGMRVGICRLG